MTWQAGTIWALVGAFILCTLLPQSNASADAPDFPIPNGHFFKQTNGANGAGETGFAVTDADRVPFWTVYRRLGGPEEVGYPISQRFVWNGAISQGFQKVVLQWNQQTQSVVFVNIFDELSRAGRDDWLRDQKGIPPPVDFGDADRPWDQAMRNRLALLDRFPKIKGRYQRSVDPLAQFGLPTSYLANRDDAVVVRFQRAVIEQWKVDNPGVQAGDVALVNGGEIAKEAGMLPRAALTPQAWRGARPAAPAAPASVASRASPAASTSPEATAPLTSALPEFAPIVVAPRGVVLSPLRPAPTRADGRPWRVVLDPGHGGSEIGSARPMGSGLVMVEKNVNLQISLRAAELLLGAGLDVAITRDTDRQVNWPGYDLNGDGQVIVSDDLQARVEMANRFGADVFVSVHNNGHNNPAQYGTEVYYNADRPHSAHNWALAWYLNQRILQLVRLTGYPTLDRGVKTDTTTGVGHFSVLGPQSPTIPSPGRMTAALT